MSRITKLEKDPKLKRQVIRRLFKGENQWSIARSVGLNQAQISRFHCKYKELIKKKKELQWKRRCDRVLKKFRENFDRKQNLYSFGLNGRILHNM